MSHSFNPGYFISQNTHEKFTRPNNKIRVGVNRIAAQEMANFSIMSNQYVFVFLEYILWLLGGIKSV